MAAHRVMHRAETEGRHEIAFQVAREVIQVCCCSRVDTTLHKKAPLHHERLQGGSTWKPASAMPQSVKQRGTVPTEAQGVPPGLQSGLEPGRYIYHSLLRISVKLGRPLSSLQALVNDMRQDNLQPDSATYTPLMHACANAGDSAAAHAVLAEATAEGMQCTLSISVAGQQCFQLM